MKSLFVIFFCISVIPVWAQESPEQTLVRIENERLQAILKKDTATILKIYDDSYQGVLASGHAVDKAGVIEFHLSGSPHIQIGIEDVKATVYGTIGVTTGKQVNKSKSGTVIGQSRFMRIYQKNGTGWRIIRSQGTIMVQD